MPQSGGGWTEEAGNGMGSDIKRTNYKDLFAVISNQSIHFLYRLIQQALAEKHGTQIVPLSVFRLFHTWLKGEFLSQGRLIR